MAEERQKRLKSSFDDFLERGERALKTKKYFTALSSFTIAKSIANALANEATSSVGGKGMKKLDKGIGEARKKIDAGIPRDVTRQTFLSRLREQAGGDTTARAPASTKVLPIFLFGLDRAGKTTFVDYLEHEKFKDQSPTLGINLTQLVLGNVKFEFNDLGGQERFRDSWMDYWKNQSVLVFMVDVADAARFGEARDALWSIISRVETVGKPLLILLNKIDLPDAKDAVTVKKALDFYKIDRDPLAVHEISVKEGRNLEKPLNFLASIALEDDELQAFISEETRKIADELGVIYDTLLDEARNLEKNGNYEKALNQVYKAKLIQDEIAASGISSARKKSLQCLG